MCFKDWGTAGMLLAATCVLPSCAPLFYSTNEAVVARGPRIQTIAVPEPSRDLLRVQGYRCGQRLTLFMTVLHACDERVDTRITIERKQVRSWAAPLVELAIAATGFAVFSLAKEHARSKACNASNPPQCSTSGSYAGSVVAVSGLLVGIGFSNAAIVDAVRPRVFTDMLRREEKTRRPRWCQEEPAAHRRATVFLPNGVGSTQLDAGGVGRIELPREALTGMKLRVAVDSSDLVLEVPEDRCAPSR